MIELEIIAAKLPADGSELRAEALAEGFRHLERLAAGWESGMERFDRAGERLIAARLNGALAGIGGVTIDPVAADFMRMRRFYVCPAFRRRGVGREIAKALLAHVGDDDRKITVNAAAASFPFWESLGFVLELRHRRTHILRMATPKSMRPLTPPRPSPA